MELNFFTLNHIVLLTKLNAFLDPRSSHIVLMFLQLVFNGVVFFLHGSLLQL